MMWVPTSPRVSRDADQQLGVEPADGLGQAVADLLEPAGQARVVEREPDVVLDDAQPLAGAVGRGVEDAAEVDPLARLGQLQRRDLARPAGSARPRRRRPRRADRAGASSSSPARGQQVGDRPGRGEQARQQVLGADRPGPVERPAPGSSRRSARRGGPATAGSGRSAGVRPRRRRASSGSRPERGPRRRSGSRPNSASSSAARLSASSTRAASRSAGSTAAAPRRRARASARSRARRAPGGERFEHRVRDPRRRSHPVGPACDAAGRGRVP